MTETEWRNRQPETALIEWRGEIYVGQVQEIASEYSKEIVFLTKTFHPKARYEHILKRGGKLTSLYADDSLELTGRYHLVRRTGDELTSLTSEQREYMDKRMLRVYEMMVNDEILGD
ncbi:MAG: hypothetical protein ACLFVI_08040 [Archaeoglobaceae archaeon]